MRCPKCQYISFESGDRCRNCGYEFSLAIDDADADAPVDVVIARDEPAPGRIRDASLAALDTPLSSPARDAGIQSYESDDTLPGPLPTAADLPLFTERVADDQAPLVTPPAVPRPPLAVRRTSPAARHRPRPGGPEELSLDLAAGADADETVVGSAQGESVPSDVASLPRRFIAGLIDVGILGSIVAAVVALTLRLCELTIDQWRVLPLAPLLAFLLLLCGGYFVLFTAAGGQTIGKMTTSIRVVGANRSQGLRVSFSTALMRALACFGSVAALGTGFLPAVFSGDRRTFHDRVAGTRVVSA
jgi:uncharacterized RDD family membrane protein YckC